MMDWAYCLYLLGCFFVGCALGSTRAIYMLIGFAGMMAIVVGVGLGGGT